MQNPCAEHIVCVFPENIITRFNVLVNNVVKEFAERLQLAEFCDIIIMTNVFWRLSNE